MFTDAYITCYSKFVFSGSSKHASYASQIVNMEGLNQHSEATAINY